MTLLLLLATPAQADLFRVFLAETSGARIEIAQLRLAADQSYAIEMNGGVFTDHFLSMRPFKCLEGPEKHWCHVPYPYDIKRDISSDVTDLEYDFLFLWKGASDYGIDTWNGVYYRLEPAGAGWIGTLNEIDLGQLGIPPPAGELRPISPRDLHESDADSHWLPQLVIEPAE